MKVKLIVLLLVLLSLSVMLVSCGRKGCEAGVHTLDEGVVTTAPTCVDEGVRTFTCTLCGETVAKAEPKSDEVHRFNVGVVTDEPDCLNDGVRTVTCILCNKSETQAAPATGAHDWSAYEVTQAATCGVAGVKTKTCNACGTKQDEAIDPTGLHKYDEGVEKTPATCGTAGIKVRTCQNEGCGVMRESSIPATGKHVPQEEYVIADDVHYNKCKTCDLHMNEQTHRWDTGEVITPADGCKSGIKRSTCTVCEHTDEVAFASSVPHTSTNTIDKEQGKLICSCTVCGEGFSYTIQKLHDMEDDITFLFKDSGGSPYTDKTDIHSKIVEGADSNKYQAVVVPETLSSAKQIQNVGTLPCQFESFIVSFDIMSPSEGNNAEFGIQFFNPGTSDWGAGRGVRFLELKGNSVETTRGLAVATLSTTEWTNIRIEVEVTANTINVQYFANNVAVGQETFSNSMYQQTVVSLYIAGNWKTQNAGYYFDNILVATK